MTMLDQKSVLAFFGASQVWMDQIMKDFVGSTVGIKVDDAILASAREERFAHDMKNNRTHHWLYHSYS